MSDKKDNNTTQQGHVPGSISTAGQFQVWAKMQIEHLLKRDGSQGDEIKEVRTETTTKLNGFHNRQNEMDKIVAKLEAKVTTLWKVVGALGGGLVSVIGSLIVWYLTKG